MKKRNGAVELYRFLFACVIMFRHGNKLIPTKFITKLFTRGALGVEFFFFVSGVLMAQSAFRYRDTPVRIGDETARFLKRKYVGLFPEFPIAVLISFIFSCITHNYSLPKMIVAARDWLWSLLPVSMFGFSNGSFHMGAWYISAMLIAMAILYPLCLKWFDFSVKVLFPLIALALLGYLQRFFGTPLGPSIEVGLFYKGMIRAVAEIALGAALYSVIEQIRTASFSKFGRVVLLVCTLLLTAAIFYQCCYSNEAQKDTLTAILIAVLVVLLFSHQVYGFEKLDCPFVYKLGKYSFLVYISHGEYVKLLEKFNKQLAAQGYFHSHRPQLFATMTTVYILGVACIVLMISLLSPVVARLWNRFVKKCVAPETEEKPSASNIEKR